MLLAICSITIGLFYCSSYSTNRVEGDFQKYLATLEVIETPVHFEQDIILPKSINYDSALHNKFKSPWSLRPQGKMFETDSSVLIVDISSSGDQRFFTFDYEGHKLDSLFPFRNAYHDMGYMGDADVSINKNEEIVVIESIRKWDFKADSSDLIEGSDKLKVDTLVFKTNVKGKFKKVNR